MSNIEIFVLYFVFTGLVTYALERYDLKQIRAGKHKEEMQAIEEKKLKEKIKKAEQEQRQMNKTGERKGVLVNRANTIKNSELRER